jgi:hypothetical protein
LFLKILIEGKASLYYYKGQNIERFFYSVNAGDSIKELIYKNYIDENNQVQSNKAYIQQLWQDVKCDNDVTSVQNLDYKTGALENYFETYNKCAGNDYVQYDKKKNKGAFHAGIFAGIDYASLKTWNSATAYTPFSCNYGSKIEPTFGLDLAYTLPWNNNKWEILLQPTYHSFIKNATAYSSYAIPVSAKYSVIDFPIGGRYNFFLDKNSKIFIDGLFFLPFQIPLNKIVQSSVTLTIGSSRSFNFAFDAGYAYKRLSAELRYYTNQNILNGSAYVYWGSKYSRFSFIVGYRIF